MDNRASPISVVESEPEPAHLGAEHSAGPAGSAVALLLLAAGAGSRFSEGALTTKGPLDGSAGPSNPPGEKSHKLLAPLRGKPVFWWTLRAAILSGVGQVVVVTGAVDLSGVIAEFEASAARKTAAQMARENKGVPPGAPCAVEASDRAVVTVNNPLWTQGLASSLMAGIGWCQSSGKQVALVCLGDQPFVAPEAFIAVASAGSPVAFATYNGKRGHPVRLHREVWPLLPATGEIGARALARSHPALVTEIECPGSPADIDTMADLAELESEKGATVLW